MSDSLVKQKQFNTKLAALLDKHVPASFPAVSVCALHNGETILERAWGWIDPESRALPVASDTRFDLASVTKLFAETSFLTLVDQGKIGLNSRLADVIPEFADLNPREIAGGQDPHNRRFLPAEGDYLGQTVDVRDVTFKHLLTHTSGLPPWRSVYLMANENPPASPQPGQRYDDSRWQTGLAAMVRFPFAGPVGSKVRYTDIGIMLLGEAVARMYGARLDIAIKELLLEPLDLQSIIYNPVANGIARENIAPTEYDGAWRKRRVWGEVHDENACGLGGIAGHAGLFATARDVARFGQAWLSDDSRLRVSRELRQEATRQHAHGQFRLGLGWMLKAAEDSSAGDSYSPASYGHTGFTGTSLWIDPERRLVTALLTNRVYHGRQPEDIHAFRRAFHDMIVKSLSR